MGKVFVEITMSLDGFITRPNVNADNPFGDGGDVIHDWMFANPTALEQQIAAEMHTGTGAYIIGRHMFDLGEAPWGDDGAFRKPCFVLTHRPRPTLVKGPTTFTFVTTGLEHCFEQARQAAGDQDICIAGGAQVVQQALQAKLVDELRLHVAPLLFFAGTRLFDNINLAPIKLETSSVRQTAAATHLRLRIR